MAISTTTPGQPKIIQITITSGIVGQPLTVLNRNNGDIYHTTILTATKALVDLQNVDNNYTSGHVIEIIVTGVKNGSNTVTTSGTAPQSVTVATSANSDTARGI